MDFSDKCRTCLTRSQLGANFINITNHCLLGKSFRQVLTMLIPEMDKTLTDDNCICEYCVEALKRVIVLIHNCLVIEANFDRCKFIVTRDNETGTAVNNGITIQPGVAQVATNAQLKNGKNTVDVGNQSDNNPNQNLNIEPRSNSTNLKTNEPQDVNVVKIDDDMDIECYTIQDDARDDSDHDNYFTSKTAGSGISFFRKIKRHNRILSLETVNHFAAQKFIACLSSNNIAVSDISKTNEGNKSDKRRILLIGTDIPDRCLQCSKPLKKNKEHTCKKVVKKKGKCPKCDKTMNVDSMRYHMRKHQRDEYKIREQEREEEAKRLTSLICGTCNEQFTTTEEFNFHLELHPPHKCEQCGKGFVKKESLKAHMATHNAPNSFICEICGKGYKDAGMLRVHLKTHEENQSVPCNHCPKVFKNNYKLRIHIKRVHFKVNKSQCTYCGKLFVNGSLLSGHVKLVHFKEKPYQCHVCQKRFGRTDYLNNHMLRHKGEIKGGGRRRYKIQETAGEQSEQPVKCKFCGSVYKDLVRLKRHLETHVKRYPCPSCPLTFARKALAQRHMKSHEGSTENLFRCNVCWKRFESKEALEEHLTCHDKPRHSCDLCGKPFNRKFLMNHHKLMEHSNIPDKEEAEEIIYDSLLEASNGNGIEIL